MGILVVILAVIGILPNFIAAGYNSLIKIMNGVVAWVAEQEAFIFKDIPFDGVHLLLAYMMIIALITALSKINFKRFVLLLTAIIGFQVWSLILSYTATRQEKVIILHQTANTVLFRQKNIELSIHTSDTTRTVGMATDYKIAERIKKIVYRPINNSYIINRQNVLLVDSLAILPEHISPEILWLTQSPKINLDRYLNNFNPRLIIADGSNYTSYVNRWRQTCAKRKLPFHHTGEKGAYYFKIAN
jgi:competence protein ComEC